MTTVHVIDEAGSLGHKGRYFVMADLIANNPRLLKKLYGELPICYPESKFHSAYEEEKIRVLKAVGKSSISIVFIAIDKYSPKYSDLRGNSLYLVALYELLLQCSTITSRNDVSIYLDSTTSITSKCFSSMTREIFSCRGKNIRRSIKVDSAQNKCIQLADYVVGAIRYAYEYGDTKYYNLIREKVSVARGL